MGRPRLSREKLRTINFTIRLTADELVLLGKAAETCGRVPGTFAREKIFNGKLPEAKLARVDLQTYLELKKMGVNLNQLTRLANMGMGGRALANVLMQLIQQQEQIISLLLHYDSKPENR